MRRLASSLAAGFGAEATVDFRVIFAPMVNNEAEAIAYGDAAAELVGEANVRRDGPPGMGSEDFSFMMEQVPGRAHQPRQRRFRRAAQSSVRFQRRGDPLRRGAVRRDHREEAAAGNLRVSLMPWRAAAPPRASSSTIRSRAERPHASAGTVAVRPLGVASGQPEAVPQVRRPRRGQTQPSDQGFPRGPVIHYFRSIVNCKC